MSTVITGVVTNGVIVPSSPLPEGTVVEFQICLDPCDVPPDLQAELRGWQQMSAKALALVEQLAQENEDDEKR